MERSHLFPLIADGEPVITPGKQMRLYDEEDLITNIKGAYQEKDYETDHADGVLLPDDRISYSRRPEKSYAAKAREEARLNLKKKRQAYINTEPRFPSNGLLKQAKVAPISPYSKEVTDEKMALTQAAAKLHQETYILAEIPKRFEQPQNESKQKPTKNNYDFLKKSQVYNYPENQRQKEHHVARELNLTHFE